VRPHPTPAQLLLLSQHHISIHMKQPANGSIAIMKVVIDRKRSCQRAPMTRVPPVPASRLPLTLQCPQQSSPACPRPRSRRSRSSPLAGRMPSIATRDPRNVLQSARPGPASLQRRSVHTRKALLPIAIEICIHVASQRRSQVHSLQVQIPFFRRAWPNHQHCGRAHHKCRLHSIRHRKHLAAILYGHLGRCVC
jgi:hypothetical protein